jgi:hypothetical protein
MTSIRNESTGNATKRRVSTGVEKRDNHLTGLVLEYETAAVGQNVTERRLSGAIEAIGVGTRGKQGAKTSEVPIANGLMNGVRSQGSPHR